MHQRYWIGLWEPSEILIRASLYERNWASRVEMNSSMVVSSQSRESNGSSGGQEASASGVVRRAGLA